MKRLKMNKMKKSRHTFHKGIELHKVCSNDLLRPVMNYIYFEHSYAIASDGRILIKAKVSEISNFNEQEIELLNGHFLHATGFRILMKHDVVSVEKDGFLAQGDSYSIKIHFCSDETMKFPNYQRIFDEWSPGDHRKIVLNTHYLSKIVDSVNAKDVRMRFGKNDNQGIILQFPVSDLNDTKGMIMPKLDSDDF